MHKWTLAILGGALSLGLAAGVLPARGAHQEVSLAAPLALPPRAPLDTCRPGSAPDTTAIGGVQTTLQAALSQRNAATNQAGEIFVRLDLSGFVTGPQRPVALALVIDRSGSMAGDKAWQAREAAAAIIDRLGPDDQVALVQYDDGAELLVPLTAADALGKARLRGALGGVYPVGATNLGEGLTVGREALLQTLTSGQLNRMVVLSDGLANAGITDRAGLAQLAEDASARGVSVTAVGVGVDYDEDALAQIADAGRGHYYYVRDAAGLRAVLEGELDALRQTVATGVSLRLEPLCAGIEVKEILGYPARYQEGAAILSLADLSAGAPRKLVARLQVPALPEGHYDLLQVSLHLKETSAAAPSTLVTALGLHVTSQIENLSSAQNNNEQVLRGVIEAESGLAIQRAAEFYEAGQQDEAGRLLREQAIRGKKFAEDNELDAAAAAPALDALGSASTVINAAPRSNDDQKAAIKDGKYRARDIARH